MNGQRALMAVVFTDAVGYSARAAHNEEEALRLLQDDFDLMRTSAEGHGGRVLKSTGDGLLMAFDSAGQAVDSALDIQRQFANRPETFFQHRMGVHLCDLILEANDAHGDGVNLAARLEAEATPGGICLSQTIYDIVKSRLPVQAKFLGERKLKNLVEPVPVFEIGPDNAPRGERIPPRSKRSYAAWAMPAAVLFLGVCLVSAAVVVANRPAEKPATERTYIVREPEPIPFTNYSGAFRQTGGALPRKDSPAVPTLGKKPAAQIKEDAKKPSTSTSSAVMKEEPSAADSELVAAVGGAEAAKELVAKYRQARAEHRKDYDFGGMVQWIEGEDELKNSPAFRTLQLHWKELSSLKENVETELSQRSSEQPLKVKMAGEPNAPEVLVWSSKDGKVVIQRPGGKVTARDLSGLDPAMLRNIALAACETAGVDSERQRRMLSAFDREYAYAIRRPQPKSAKPLFDDGSK